MTCQECREGLSARLDIEDPGVPLADLDGHLAACAACRVWFGEAERMHRALRIARAEPVPDLSASIVASVWGESGRRRRTLRLARVALVVVAAAQVALVVPELAGQAHVTHEIASWNTAVAVGFLFAALRPPYGAGLIPIVGAAVVALFTVTVRDLLRSEVQVEQEFAHLLLLIGLLLLLALRRGGDRPPRRVPTADPLPRTGGTWREAA